MGKIEIIDALNRPLTLNGAARRIVSLVPSITETCFMLGAGDSVVGVSEYCTHPPEGVAVKEKIGGVKNPDIEKIIELAPDLVLANKEENHKKHIERLDNEGIPVFMTYPKTVKQGLRMVRDIALMTDTVAQAEKTLLPIEEVYRDISRLADGEERTSVFCPIWKDPYMTISGDTYIHDVLWSAGGSNIFASKSDRYPKVRIEEVIEAAPEVILLPDEPYEFREEDLPDFLKHPEIPAVENDRIHFIDGKITAWFGPRIGEGLVVVCNLLSPY